MGFGNVFGGAAKGIATGLELGQRNRELDLYKRGLDIKEQQDGTELLKQLKEQVNANIGEGLQAIEKVIEGGHASPAANPEKIAATVDEIWAGIEANARSIGRDLSGIRAGIEARIAMPPAPKADRVGSTLESIKAKLAAGQTLTAGEQKVYNDAQRLSMFDRILLGQGAEAPPPEAAAPPEPVPTATPPVPQSLSGKNPMWSPSRQRWYLPDGTSYNQQGVPVS